MLKEVKIPVNSDNDNTYYIGIYKRPDNPKTHVVLMQHFDSFTSVSNGYEEIAKWAMKNLPELENKSQEELIWHETYWAEIIQNINEGNIHLGIFNSSHEIEDIFFKKENFQDPVWQLSSDENAYWLLGEILHDLANSWSMTLDEMFRNWATQIPDDKKTLINLYIGQKLAPYGYLTTT